MQKSLEIEDKFFKYAVDDLSMKVCMRSHGNYTKHYESFKRIENTEVFFRKEISRRNKANVLDIGCGDGYHVCVFNTNKDVQEKASFIGIDISPTKIYIASHLAMALSFENVSFRIGSAEALEFSDDSIDIVLCSDVVEHLLCPEKCFTDIFRILKPGGVAIITTPNASYPLLKLKDYIRGNNTILTDKEEHISLKGLKEWIRISRNSGFTVSGVRRGALIFGGYPYNRHPALFSFIVIIDRLFDFIPFFKNWAEAITIKLIKLRNV